MGTEEKGTGKPPAGRDEALPPAREAADSPAETRRLPSWRAWAVSIIAAVVLSAAVTLLLGGSSGTDAGRTAAGGCGESCCAPQERDGK